MTVNIDDLRKTVAFAEESFVVDAQSYLHEMMQAKGKTRADLAAAMGVSRARVSQLFSSECKNFTVRLLARAFFALGERVEITCEHSRMLLHSTSATECDFNYRSDCTWEFGAVNDNGIEVVEDGDVEVAFSTGGREMGRLVASMSKALGRERVMA